MKKILMIYGNELSPDDLELKPLAGTQTAFIELSRSFSSLGHHVTVLTKTNQFFQNENYRWSNLEGANDLGEFDLMIVNVSVGLFDQLSHVSVKKRVLWIHNQAKYLLYWSRLKYLIKYRPLIVFSGKYHKSTLPFFIPTGGRRIIPYGLSSDNSLMNTDVNLPEGKKVYFTSNPLRSLRWLVDLWVLKIHPQVPTAELHIFSDWRTYGKWGESVKNRMKSEIEYAAAFKNSNVIIRNVLPKSELFIEMSKGRAMFYRGDQAETFCLAVAEAQALGLPAVVTDLGSMKERVINERTGYVAQSDDDFIRFAVNILNEDELWLKMSKNAKEIATEYTWVNAANGFLSLIK